MHIRINGKTEDLAGVTEISVMDLLKSKGVEPRMVAVEVNSEMLEKEDYESRRLKEGDSVEFLYFMGGGV